MTAPITCNPQRIPEELRQYRQWVVWCNVPDPEKPEAKPRKILYNPKTNCEARTHNDARKEADGKYTDAPADTWSSFETAVRAFRKSVSRIGQRYDGIGFVFTDDDPFIGGDIDGCRNPETGEIDPEALFYVQLAGTYTELSPSGTGVKFIGRGKKPKPDTGKAPCKNDALGVEMYDTERFFTLTGCHVEDTPETIEDRQAEFDGLYYLWFPPKQAQEKVNRITSPANILPDDSKLLDIARAAANGALFTRLYDRGDLTGNHNNHSCADLALCSLLAFYTGPDENRIDQLFRQSALMRDKWDRDDYKTRTIAKALAGKTTFFGDRSQSFRNSGGTPIIPEIPEIPSQNDPEKPEQPIEYSEWKKLGKRLQKWKSDTDEAFRWQAGRWYDMAVANVPPAHKGSKGGKFEAAFQIFGAMAYQMKEWAGTVRAWPEEKRDPAVPFWVHQEVRAAPPEGRAAMIEKFKTHRDPVTGKGMNREMLREELGHVTNKKPPNGWKMLPEDSRQEIENGIAKYGSPRVAEAIRLALAALAAQEKAADRRPYEETDEDESALLPLFGDGDDSTPDFEAKNSDFEIQSRLAGESALPVNSPPETITETSESAPQSNADALPDRDTVLYTHNAENALPDQRICWKCKQRPARPALELCQQCGDAVSALLRGERVPVTPVVPPPDWNTSGKCPGCEKRKPVPGYTWCGPCGSMRTQEKPEEQAVYLEAWNASKRKQQEKVSAT